ncbi:putative protein YqcC [Vibrio stylophorae]|uniref:YqcC-like domain-containing protein n=1 Tax=Vibrio stylophorae TaxID=659351 RepID=A0ABM8ZV84_9VIBR|nr:YqcC family protein [Vibrio stylophorae]CAH0534242.1 putative protein YqcC [Vibrio stylophorae]
MNSRQECEQLLNQLEVVLKQQGCWQSQPPSPQALQSVEPFAIDTLTPTEWLQWILIPRMQALLRSGAPLPSTFCISPYFEQSLLNLPYQQAILEITLQLDDRLGAAS